MSDDGSDERELYGMHTYNFAWYFPRVDGYRDIVKASALAVTSFLILPGLVLLGYSYRVGRAAATGAESPARGLPPSQSPFSSSLSSRSSAPTSVWPSLSRTWGPGVSRLH